MSIIRHAFLHLRQERSELVLVGAPKRMGIGQDLGHALQSLEERRVAERKLELGRVEDVKDDDLVAAMAEVLEAGDDPWRRRRTGRKRSPRLRAS